MSSNARTGDWPHKTLCVDSLPFAVSRPLSPAVTWDHLPNRPLVFGRKNARARVCVCVCVCVCVISGSPRSGEED